jgi:transcriptional regulator with XRE-family HTH domain
MPVEPVADLDAFREALRLALDQSPLSQKQVAAELELKSESSISDWKQGRVATLQPAQVFALEEVLDCHPGELSTHLGFLPLSAAGTVEAAIISDRDLSPDFRRVVLDFYRKLRREHAGRSERPQDASKEGDLALKASTGRTP